MVRKLDDIMIKQFNEKSFISTTRRQNMFVAKSIGLCGISEEDKDILTSSKNKHKAQKALTGYFKKCGSLPCLLDVIFALIRIRNLFFLCQEVSSLCKTWLIAKNNFSTHHKMNYFEHDKLKIRPI